MKKVFCKIYHVLILILPAINLLAANPDSTKTLVPDREVWVDSVMKSLSQEEKIAQLLMIRTYSNKDQDYYKNTEAIIRKYNIGGLCFFQGGPRRQASLTARYQQIAKTPLLISLDAEWGLGMRLDSTRSYPFQMTLGSINDDTLIYNMGRQVAKQLKSIGTHINFAPVVDVNNNPANPVINSRSFGSDPERVASKGIAYMKGLQDGGIIATAKHFPGHGDTDSDSHYTLPVINHSRERLDSIEFYPFKRLIAEGLDATMVAHLYIPALDSTANTPTTLSEKVVNELLKNELGFKGLVVTDALDMKGVTSGHQPGEIEVKAFLAGNDILLLPQDVGAAVSAISKAIQDSLISESELNDRCKKIIEAKYNAGLYLPVQISMDTIQRVLYSHENELLEQQLYEAAVTVLRNEDALIPLRKLDTLKIAVVSAGAPEITDFQEMLSNYTHVEKFNILSASSPQQRELLLEKLKDFNLVIVGIHGTNIYPTKKFGISEQTLQLVNKIADSNKTILTVFASPYSLNLIDSLDRFDGLILAHQDVKAAQTTAAQIIMGSIPASGVLPVSLNKGFHAGSGIKTEFINRLKYTIPEEVKINREDLQAIDTIVFQNIRNKAIPGCQVLVAVDGKVIYHKAFGYHTYKKGDFVKTTDLYDLASITKVAATTISVMKLYDNRKLDIDQKLVNYLPYLGETNKENIVIRELMAHQAQLKPWIPFYINTLSNGKPDKKLYTTLPDDNHTLKVTAGLYLDRNYKYVMIDTIIGSELRKKREYKYSDLGFILLNETIENLTNKPLDRYANDNFYKPLGFQYTCFNPLNSHKLNTIVPTEEDNYFRNQLIHGYVHDPAAAMMGGVSGHAGLFSNANELAILMQMLLQGGYYGGEQYLRESTVLQFTKQQFPLNENRRGIGFDKPEPGDRKLGPTCESASLESFGHTGFTGTYAWVDPKYNMVFIFLSNRVNPTAANTKLIKNNTRTKIQQVIYDALKKSRNFNKPSEEIGQLKTPNPFSH
ncbi:MAG: glycoside hydrolase family 3 N-terminal domain-containing protein [Bacteroidales bacterium]